VAGQLDILPTTVALAGLNRAHQALGRDLFSLPPGDPGHAYIKRPGEPTVGWIEGNRIVLAAPGRRPSVCDFDLSFPPACTADLIAQEPQLAARMSRTLEAFVESALHILEGRKAAPPTPGAGHVPL
jgi:hypothetical protein